MTTINAAIDQLLAERRPDRYGPNDMSWLDEIGEEINGGMTELEARQIATRTLVRQRETQKIRQGNRVLREMFKAHNDGQDELDELEWMTSIQLPIVVGDQRVALRAVTADDLEDFANEEERRANVDHGVRLSTCEAARWFAAEMRRTKSAALGALHQVSA